MPPPLKPSAANGTVIQGGVNTFSPLDATTYFLGGLPASIPRAEGGAKLRIPFTGTVKSVYVNWFTVGVAGSNESIAASFRLNAATDTAVASVGDTNAQKIFLNSAIAIAVAAGDTFEIKLVAPTWATNPTNVMISFEVYIEQS